MENSFTTIKENCPSHRIQLDMTFKSYTLSIPTLFVYPTNQRCPKANCAHVAAVLSIIFGRSSKNRKVRRDWYHICLFKSGALRLTRCAQTRGALALPLMTRAQQWLGYVAPSPGHNSTVICCFDHRPRGWTPPPKYGVKSGREEQWFPTPRDVKMRNLPDDKSDGCMEPYMMLGGRFDQRWEIKRDRGLDSIGREIWISLPLFDDSGTTAKAVFVNNNWTTIADQIMHGW
jgi:hypothetical protein